MGGRISAERIQLGGERSSKRWDLLVEPRLKDRVRDYFGVHHQAFAELVERVVLPVANRLGNFVLGEFGCVEELEDVGDAVSKESVVK